MVFFTRKSSVVHQLSNLDIVSYSLTMFVKFSTLLSSVAVTNCFNLKLNFNFKSYIDIKRRLS